MGCPGLKAILLPLYTRNAVQANLDGLELGLRFGIRLMLSSTSLQSTVGPFSFFVQMNKQWRMFSYGLRWCTLIRLDFFFFLCEKKLTKMKMLQVSKLIRWWGPRANKVWWEIVCFLSSSSSSICTQYFSSLHFHPLITYPSSCLSCQTQGWVTGWGQ